MWSSYLFEDRAHREHIRQRFDKRHSSAPLRGDPTHFRMNTHIMWAGQRSGGAGKGPCVRLLEDVVQVMVAVAALVEHHDEVLVDVHQVADELLAPLLQEAACSTQAARQPEGGCLGGTTLTQCGRRDSRAAGGEQETALRA